MKRLLLFVLLLVLGFVALHFAVGDDAPATAGTGSRPDRPRPPPGEPIRVQAGGVGVQLIGPQRFGHQRLVQTADGSRKERIYELTCDNCTPQPDGTYRLDGVAVQLFDADEPVADLVATQGIVTLQLEGNNQHSIREDKDIALSAAVLTTVPGARIGQLRMECAEVRARVTENEVALRTPDERQPVTIEVGGERPGVLRGRGLQAHIPKDRGVAQGQLDFLLQHEPSLTSAGATVRAKGALHYVEEVRTGAALLTLDQEVAIDLDSAAAPAAAAAGAIHIAGDQLTCWLQRTRPGAIAPGGSAPPQSLVWQRIRLLGAPATVRGNGLDLHSARLAAEPGPFGQPAVLTAYGGPAELHQSDPHGGSGTFASSQPIRLLRPIESIGAVHRCFGFPAWTLRPLQRLEIVAFDGDSSLDATDGVHLRADRGLFVFRVEADANTTAVVARGFGAVTIEQGKGAEHIVANGDNGFLLRRGTAGDVLVLGADDPAAAQHFELQRGELIVRGTGACRVDRDPDDTAHVLLRSADNTIRGTFGRDLGELRSAALLEIAVREGEIRSFHTGGPLLHAVFARGDERLEAWADDVEQTGRAEWRLLGAAGRPAHLQRPAVGRDPPVDLTAPRLDVFQLAAAAVLLDAQAAGGESAHLTTAFAPTGKGAGNVDVTAQRIRLLPFALPPAVLARHFAGMPRALQRIMAHTLGQAWILADGRLVAHLDDPQHGQSRGEGESLVLCRGAMAGMLIGDVAAAAPACLHNRDADGRDTTARGARVRFFRADGDYITVLPTFPDRSLLLPPSLELHDHRPGAGRSPLADLRAECRDEIELLPDAVLFHGPVRAHTLTPDGTEDPRGMYVVAQHLTIERMRATGEVTRVEADGGVTFDWRQLHARSARVELDPRWQRCIADDPGGAELLLATRNGGQQTYRARRIEANYVTYAVRIWDGSLGQEQEPAKGR